MTKFTIGYLLLPGYLSTNLCHAQTVAFVDLGTKLSNNFEPGKAAGNLSPMGSETTPLDWTLGDWNGHRKDGISGAEYPITIRVHSVLGGAGITEEMEVVHGTDTYRAFSITAFEKSRSCWVMHYLNKPTGESIPMEGVIEGTSITWKSVNPMRIRESKLVYEHNGKADWKRTQYMSEDAGKTWIVVFTDTLARS